MSSYRCVTLALVLISNTDNKVMNVSPVIKNLLLLAREKFHVKFDLLRNRSGRLHWRVTSTLILISNTDNKVMNVSPVIKNLLLLARGKFRAKSDLLRNRSRYLLTGVLH